MALSPELFDLAVKSLSACEPTVWHTGVGDPAAVSSTSALQTKINQVLLHLIVLVVLKDWLLWSLGGNVEDKTISGLSWLCFSHS